MAKSRPSPPQGKTVQVLRRIALGYPEAEEGVSCSKAAFKARNKAFLFVGMDDAACNVMVKLGESLAEATKLAADEPDFCRVGAHGWVTVVFGNDQTAPTDLLKRWIDESYRMLVPKQLVAQLPGRGRRPSATAKKK